MGFYILLKICIYRISRKAWAGRGLDRHLVVGGDSFAVSDKANISTDDLPIGTEAVGSPTDVVLSSAGSKASIFRGSESTRHRGRSTWSSIFHERPTWSDIPTACLGLPTACLGPPTTRQWTCEFGEHLRWLAEVTTAVKAQTFVDSYWIIRSEHFRRRYLQSCNACKYDLSCTVKSNCSKYIQANTCFAIFQKISKWTRKTCEIQ